MSSQRASSATSVFPAVQDALDRVRAVRNLSPSALQARAKALGLEPVRSVVIDSELRSRNAVAQCTPAVQGRELIAEERALMSVFERTEGIVSIPTLSSLEELDYPTESRVKAVLHRLFRLGLVESVPSKGWRLR